MRRALALGLLLAVVALPLAVAAQPARVYRVGVILFGGPHSSAVDGLRDGLRDQGLEEGKQVVLDVRDAKGDLKAVEAAARSLEEHRVEVIVAMTTGVTFAARRATKSVPIVFYSGSDPVALRLVQSYRKPGGRLTGIHSQSAVLAGKRLELLKEMVPRLHRVVTCYRPDAPTAEPAVKIAREAARQLRLELVERLVASAEELRAGLRALRPGEVDAFLYVGGGMAGHVDLIIESARVKRLPTMFSDRVSVTRGGLAAYGESCYTIGRLSARHVQRVLLGADSADLPIEQVDKFHFVVSGEYFKLMIFSDRQRRAHEAAMRALRAKQVGGPRPNARKHLFPASPVAPVRIPASFSHRDQMTPARHQGQRGTCTVFGVSAQHEFNWSMVKDFAEQYLYWGAKQIDNSHEGTWIKDAWAALRTRGVCLEATCPYTMAQPYPKWGGPAPGQAAHTEAANYRGKQNWWIDHTDLGALKTHIAKDGYVVAIQVTVWSSCWPSSGEVVMPTEAAMAETRRVLRTLRVDGSRPSRGEHVICLCGYDDATSRFEFKNSWGQNWGALGFGSIPYDYVRQYARDATVFQSA